MYKQTEEYNSIIYRLAEKYDYVAYIDGKNNEVTNYKVSDKFLDLFSGIFNKNKIDGPTLDIFWKKFVNSDEFDAFIRNTNRNIAISYINKYGSFIYKFHAVIKGELENYEISFSKDLKNEDGYILAVSNIDNQKTEEYERIEIEERLKRSALLDGLFREYYTIWLLTSKDHLLHLYGSSGKATVKESVRMAINTPFYDESIKLFIQKDVIPEDREKVLEATKFETLQKSVPNTGLYTVNYRRYDENGDIAYNQICYAKAENSISSEINYILAFRNVTKIMEEGLVLAEEKRLIERDANFFKMAILANAYSYYKVNLSKNTLMSSIIEFVDGEPIDYLTKFGEKTPSYEKIIRICADTYVDKEYCSEYKEHMSPKYLLLQYKNGNMMPSYKCKIFSTKIGWHYRSYINYLSKDEKTGDVISMVVAYNVTKETELEMQAEQFKRTLESITEDYECVIFMDFEKNKFIPYRISKQFQKTMSDFYEDKIDIKTKILNYARTHLSEVDFENNKEKIIPRTILEETQNGKHYVLTFPMTFGKETSVFEFQFIPHTQENNNKAVLLVIRNIDVQIKIQKMQQEELKNALVNAEEANQAKTKFLFNMSHDLRTPMNAIIGFSSLALKDYTNADKVLEYLTKVQSASTQLLSLIDDVLDMSRIESGKVEIREEKESILKIVKDIVNIVQADINVKEQNLKVDTSGVINENVLCDKIKLNQILLNVVSNSMKYTPAGGNISIKVLQKEQMLDERVTYQFIINDNGIGMSKDFLKILFDPFSRAKTSTVSGIQGTGLGMSITKNLVDLMDGFIDVKSKVGRGTETVITIPFKQYKVKKVDKFKLPVEEKQIVIKGMKILLVDDNDFNREIAHLILEKEGIVVTEAVNGKDAVMKVKNSEPGSIDLILMDVQMPIMDGFEATRQIRALKNEALAKIPIVAMTANVFDEDKKAAYAAGMDEHLAKPIDIQKLQETLQRFYK